MIVCLCGVCERLSWNEEKRKRQKYKDRQCERRYDLVWKENKSRMNKISFIIPIGCSNCKVLPVLQKYLYEKKICILLWCPNIFCVDSGMWNSEDNNLIMFNFHVREKGFLSFVLFSGLSWLNWFGGKKWTIIYMFVCMRVYLLLWMRHVCMTYIVLTLMMTNWPNFCCDVDDDDWLVKFVHYNRWWLDDYYCSYLKEKKKIFLHVIAAQVPCWFCAAFGRSRSILILPAKHDCCIWSWIILQDGPGFSYDVPVMMNQLWYTDCDNSANYLSIIIVLFIYFRSIGHGLVVLSSRFYSLVLFFIYTRWYHFKIISNCIAFIMLFFTQVGPADVDSWFDKTFVLW